MPHQSSPGAAWLTDRAGHSRDECLDWPFGWVNEGYGMFEVGGRRVRAHRFMCELAHGAAPEGKPLVAHSCDRRICVNPKHLRWTTAQGNADDMKIYGTHRGSKHGRSRLTEQNIADIRERIERRLSTQKELAREYGVHRSTISLAVSGKNWAHV